MCLYSSDSKKNDGVQIAYGVSTYRIYFRRLNASEWTEWLTFSDDDTVLAKAKQLLQLTNEDLNSLFAPSYINTTCYAGNDNTCANKPSGITGFGCVTLRHGAGSYTQLLWSGRIMYIRASSSGSQSNWFKFETTEQEVCRSLENILLQT